MQNLIIAGIVIVWIAIGIIFTVKHFQGKSTCCGGGVHRSRRKKLSKIIAQKTFPVGGMRCERCVARVEEVVSDIHGISGKADLKKGELTVFYAESVEDEVIRTRLEKAGYTLAEP